MKKTMMIVIVLALVGAGAYFGASALAAGESGSMGQGSGSDTDPNQPDRTAEVKGIVLSVDGTNVVIDRYIKDPSEELTDAEREARRAERQQLSQEERQALKATENAALETERVTVTVPVGTPIVKMTLDGDAPVAVATTLAEVRGTVEVTVWTDGGTDGATAEYVKLSSVK